MSKKLTNEEFLEKLKESKINYKPLEEYKGITTKIKMLCKKHNCIFDGIPYYMCKFGSGCPKCRAEKLREKLLLDPKIFEERFYKAHPNYKLLSEYIDDETKIICQCDKGHIFEVLPYSILKSKYGCKYCTHNSKIPLLEDSIYIKKPKLIKFFQKPEDAKNFYPNSSQKYIFNCPECGYTKEMVVQDLFKKGFKCDKCDLNKLSFPNSMLRLISFELEKQGLKIIKFEKYYQTNKWNVIYDGAFKYNQKLILVEMDGGFHIRQHPSSSISLEEIKEKDKNKDEFAKEIGAILIRISCFKNSLQEIKTGFYDSIFNEWFDLDAIDWEDCEIKARNNNFIKDICTYYENNKYLDWFIREKIKEKFGISETTLKKYLNIGEKLNWCNVLKININYVPFKIFTKNNEIVEYYPTVKKCIRELKNKYNIQVTESYIRGRNRNKKRPNEIEDKNYCFYFEFIDYTEYLNFLKNNKKGDKHDG